MYKSQQFESYMSLLQISNEDAKLFILYTNIFVEKMYYDKTIHINNHDVM